MYIYQRVDQTCLGHTCMHANQLTHAHAHSSTQWDRRRSSCPLVPGPVSSPENMMARMGIAPLQYSQCAITFVAGVRFSQYAQGHLDQVGNSRWLTAAVQQVIRCSSCYRHGLCKDGTRQPTASLCGNLAGMQLAMRLNASTFMSISGCTWYWPGS